VVNSIQSRVHDKAVVEDKNAQAMEEIEPATLG